MIRAIIFDLDGTIVDAYPGLHESLNEMLRLLHLPEVDIQTVKRRVGLGVLNLMEQSVPSHLVQRALELFRASYERTHIHGTSVLPDVVDTLRALVKRGILLAVASNKPPDFTRNILRHFDLNDYFKICAGPEGEILAKPHPSMLDSVMQKFQAAPAETLYVGDMSIDAETARNSGVRVALIATGGHALEELKKSSPDYLLNRFSDLIGIVDAEI